MSAPFRKKHRRRFRHFGSSIRIYLLLALTSTLAQSQPSAYTKRFTTASAVVDKTLYIISGSDSTAGNQTIAEVLALPLHKAFKVDDIPWSRRSNPGVAAEVPQVVTTKRGKYLILVGMGSLESSLVKVYDISNDKWHDLPLSSRREFIDEPRASPAIALDVRSGSVIVHGGYSSKTQMISEQLNLLRISSETDFSNWNWNNPSSEKLPRLYQPIMLYVPEVNATLVLGGCDTPNNNVSVITSCSPWSVGYLLTTTTTESGATINEPRMVTFTGADKTINSVPEARRLPCYVLLENGSVFIYGGLASNGDALKDAWILNVAAGTWLKAPLVSPGRAGGSCEKIGPSQVMVVGGYDANQGFKSFTEPQVAIIDVSKWKYTSKYTPASSMEGGITEINVWGIVGIVFGICLFFMAIGFLAGRFIWRRRALRLQAAQNKRADASNPLRPPPRKDNRNGSSNSSTNNLIPNRARMMSGNQGSSSATNTGTEDRRKLPLIIVPFPVDTASTVSRSTAPVDVVTPTDVVAPTDTPTTYNILEGDRLPKTMADIQYGHYVRTLQHGKHYDRQRAFEQRTRRVQSGISQHVDLDGDDDYLNDPMVTALVNLKEIEVGEESEMHPMQLLETDEIISDFTSANKVVDTPQTAELMLSHKKDEPYQFNYNTQADAGMKDHGNDGRGIMDKYNSIPAGGLFGNTGLGVAVALMGKANPTIVPVQEGAIGKAELMSTETGESSEGKAELISTETGERSFGKAELTSEETMESEALIDNRRFRNVAHERTWPSN
ncbi:hypothetical protein BGX34_010962 [Mortierella sp. NVP85]|nr:hypothetical protein BGX34_010962 [Mortierella sp. NVP85]